MICALIVVDFFARGIHTHTAAMCLPLWQLEFLVVKNKFFNKSMYKVITTTNKANNNTSIF